MQNFNRQLPIALTLLLVAANAMAGSVTQLGRYLIVKNQATTEQQDLLTQVFQIHFPKNIKTVGEATRFLLKTSGYSLVKQSEPSNQDYILNWPLPEIQRDFGPMSLQEGLKTLAGNTYQLLIDPIHRLVSFRLKNIYSGNYQLRNPN